LVALPLDGRSDEGVLLAEGHDFFAYPRLSRDGRRLAWLTWDHPAMPWDGTTLWVADLDAAGVPQVPKAAAGGPDEAVLQPEWGPDGHLYFLSDREGRWSLYRVADGQVEPVAAPPGELGGPLWQLGSRWYGFLDADTAIASVSEDGFSHLWLLPLGGGPGERIELPYATLAEIVCDGGRASLIAGSAAAPAALVEIAPTKPLPSLRRLASAGKLPLDESWIARPRAIDFPTAGGHRAYAFHYPPTSPDHEAPAGERPPLIVRSHGGPTSSASPALRLAYQFWTSRGFAIVDVDYRGSTGHGRAFRRALDGVWGIADVEDCVAAARYLVDEGAADPARLVIAGGSAGGYTTLCALTFTDMFKAGASYYGIGDLEALARDTHKFESRYLDRLIGPYPERADLYRERSPIHFTERLSCPAIFLQGLDDKVVPPNQAEAMVEALRRKGLPVAYLSFQGEGHGFRRAETIERALLAELAFYCRVFGIEPAEPLPDLVIENLPPRPGTRVETPS
jgi:dipeptidyl aminopeptidase/acylaminoacyl peptidase